MSFERYDYQFQRVVTSANQMEARAGVRHLAPSSEESWMCLDGWESHNVQERVLNHDRASQWQRDCRGTIYYAVHYAPNFQLTGRIHLESRLRRLESPEYGRSMTWTTADASVLRYRLQSLGEVNYDGQSKHPHGNHSLDGSGQHEWPTGSPASNRVP